MASLDRKKKSSPRPLCSSKRSDNITSHNLQLSFSARKIYNCGLCDDTKNCKIVKKIFEK